MLCLVPLAAYSQKPEAKTAPTAFDAKNIEFPSVEGWFRGTKQPMPLGQPGVFVNYESTDAERVTVYVYRHDDAEPVAQSFTGVVKEEFDGARNALKDIADAGIYKDLKIAKSDTANFAGADGKVKALRAVISFESGGNKLNSELFVFPYKGYVVKLRISRPAALPATTEQYSRFLKALDGLFSQ